LGSASIKAVPRMLMKLSPGVNFIIILKAAFVTVVLWRKASSAKIGHNNYLCLKVNLGVVLFLKLKSTKVCPVD